MKLTMRQTQRGLTLIELLAVMAIVAILAAISVVSYGSYMVRARLQDARVAVETVRAEEEQFRAEFGYYSAPNTLRYFSGTGSPAGGAGGGGAATAVAGDYQVGFQTSTATSFLIRATPQTARQSLASSSRFGGWIEVDEDGGRNSEAQPGTWP
jgi:type IV pilus assembly protein PilA